MAEPIRLITFDLDDTLWPCLPTIQAAEQTLYRWLQQHAAPLAAEHTIDSLRAHRMQMAERYPDLAHNLSEIRLRSLAELSAAHQLPAELPQRANAVFREARNRVTPYADVWQVLQGLRADFALVGVTNGNAQIEHTPLRGVFDACFTAEQVGAAKPHPALFEAASRAVGIPLSQTLHVGDDPVRDVEAARQKGMRTAWVNRAAQDWPQELAPPDLQIADLYPLIPYLEGAATHV